MTRTFGESGIQLNSIYHDQVREEVYHFGDVILEYRNNSNVKVLIFFYLFIFFFKMKNIQIFLSIYDT